MQSIFTRKILVCAVLAAVALGSAAVSSAAETRIYGTVDTGFRMTNVRGGDNTFELVSGDNYSPAFGLEGSEELTGSTEVFFKLEQGYSVDDGAMTFEGRMFGRESVLGLRGSFGTIAIGRMGSIGSAAGTYDMACALDPFGAGYTDAGIQATMIETSRLDNAVTYVSPEFAGFKFTAQYSNQIGYTESSTESSHWNENTRYTGLGLQYDIGGLHAQVMFEREWKKHSDPTDDAYFITGGISYDFGILTLYGAAQYAKNYGAGSQFGGWWYEVSSEDMINQNDSYMIGVGKTLGEAWLMTSVQYMNGKTVAGEDVNRYVAGIGATYNLSGRTSLYSALSYSNADGSLEEAGLDRTVLNFGISHTF